MNEQDIKNYKKSLYILLLFFMLAVVMSAIAYKTIDVFIVAPIPALVVFALVHGKTKFIWIPAILMLAGIGVYWSVINYDDVRYSVSGYEDWLRTASASIAFSIMAVSGFIYMVWNAIDGNNFNLLLKEYKEWSIPGMIDLAYGTYRSVPFTRVEGLYFEVPIYIGLIYYIIYQLRKLAPEQYQTLKKSLIVYIIVCVPLMFQGGQIILFSFR